MTAVNLRLDFRLLSLLLLIIIIVMAALWRPWESVEERTIAIQGEATIEATPDEFIFSPVYEKKSSDSTTAISEVSKVGNSVVAKLKGLGIPESSITTNVTTQKGYKPLTGEETEAVTAQYSLTITVNDKDLAQKILDYLVTTGPLYGVSPQSLFTKETRKKLEDDARGKALSNARAKADQTARELEVKVGKLISVSEPQWGGPISLEEKGVAPSRDTATSSTPPVLLTGEQEVTYTVSVTFQIR